MARADIDQGHARGRHRRDVVVAGRVRVQDLRAQPDQQPSQGDQTGRFEPVDQTEQVYGKPGPGEPPRQEAIRPRDHVHVVAARAQAGGEIAQVDLAAVEAALGAELDDAHAGASIRRRDAVH